MPAYRSDFGGGSGCLRVPVGFSLKHSPSLREAGEALRGKLCVTQARRGIAERGAVLAARSMNARDHPCHSLVQGRTIARVLHVELVHGKVEMEWKRKTVELAECLPSIDTFLVPSTQDGKDVREFPQLLVLLACKGPCLSGFFG